MSYAPTQKPVTIRSNSSSNMSDVHAPMLQRHRKTVSTGGGRAWSEAEEAYLIETRERKMPYKHIAAQLKKTELACRLHYHQLSFGAKSRRSATSCHPNIHHSHSVSGRSSLTPPPSSSYRQSPPQRHLPSFSPPASPPETIYRPTSNSTATASTAPPDLSHKPILPKPISSPFCRATTSSPHNLRLVTSDDNINRPCYVDLTRLDRLYDAHRLHFWSTIASEYGGNLSPATLEDAWRRAHGVSTSSNFPPTPRGSPQSSTQPPAMSDREGRPSILTTPFSAMSADGGLQLRQQQQQQQQQNGSAKFARASTEGVTIIPRSSYPGDLSSQSDSSGRRTLGSTGNGMSVSAMLTEDKEVRSPGREKTEEVEGAMAMEVDGAGEGEDGGRSQGRSRRASSGTPVPIKEGTPIGA